jgi:hypothetical protein
MAQVIEFYIPENHQRKTRWVAPEERGKVLEFPSEKPGTSLWMASGALWPIQPLLMPAPLH